MPTILAFTCPQCSSSKLEQIMTGVQICTEIEEVTEKYGVQYKRFGEISDGVIDRFQCSQCGFILRNGNGEAITTEDDLITVLNNFDYAISPNV